jgi:phosphopantothenoylcysteine decarboxylase / phosphopantothenate---cysteine ligase
MDHDMYLHPATQNNLEILSNRKHLIVGPAKGELASGLTGEGRLEEPEVLLNAVVDFFLTGNELKGVNVLVSAGPTREAIDPVRFISNRSSGKMGFAIAEQLRNRGANVTLVAGPNNLAQPSGIHYIGVESAQQMADACLSEFDKSSIIIMSAAVADYTPEVVATHKIKKTSASPNINSWLASLWKLTMNFSMPWIN